TLPRTCSPLASHSLPARRSSDLPTVKNALLLMALALAIAAFVALDLGHWLTLEGLKAAQSRVESLRDDAPLATAAGFFVLYVVVTALSLPGAAAMTIAGGAFFGL